MASNPSFDVVSEVDMQEMDNAVNQTIKEVTQRYDFKGAIATIELKDNEIKIHTADQLKLDSILDILRGKMAKRSISPRFLDAGKVETANNSTLKQTIKIKKGIEKEKAKELVQDIKNSKIRVQAQIMDDVVRVSSKDKDYLQEVIALIRGKDYGIEIQFTNYR